MKPGVIILHLTHGRLANDYKLDLNITTHYPRDFEWMYKKDKIVWLNNLYNNSTAESPLVHAFVCTSPDIMRYLHAQAKKEKTDTMVLALIHGENEVQDTTTFFV